MKLRNGTRLQPRNQRGYLLVVTIWILAAIAIAASYFADRVQASLRLAGQRQDGNEALIALHNVRQEILFRLSTTHMSDHGLGRPPSVIRLDDRRYSEGGTWLQLQDAGGLVSLSTTADDRWQRLFAQWGVPTERHASLIDCLQDYIDDDQLRRLNGAEAPQYEAAGLAGLPRNAQLLSPVELRHVFGWATVPELWKPGRVLELTTPEAIGVLNLNSAPVEVLQLLPSVGPAAAKAIIERREISPVSVGWLDRMLGTQYDTMASIIGAFPSESVRITQQARGLPWALRYNVTMTPLGADTPWKISNFYRIEKREAASISPASKSNPLPNASDTPSLPPRSVLPASSPLLLSN